MLKKIGITLVVISCIITAAAIGIALVYEKQVKKIIVSQINAQLISPVQVGDIQFSIIKDFPRASLSFYNVRAKSVYNGLDKKLCPENLFTANEISLQFNIKDIFYGNYTINKIELNSIQLFLFADQQNKDNYHFWRVDSTSNNAKVNFKMNQILINSFDAHYKDLASELIFSILFKEGRVKGEIFDEDFALLIHTKLKIQHFEVEKNHYLANKNVELNIGLLRKKNQYSFTNASAVLEKMNLLLSGYFDNENINFEAKGKDLDIQSFLSLLPEKINQKFAEYTSDGIFALDVKVNGKQKRPQVRVSFDIREANLGQKSSNVALHHLNLKGYYSNGRAQNMRSSGLYIDNFKAQLNSSPIQGKFSAVDFTNPFIDGNIEASFKLEDLRELLQLDTFAVLQGNAALKLRLSCSLAQLQQKDITQVKDNQLSGSLQLSRAKFQFKNDALAYDKIETDLYADDNYILVKELNFVHGKSQIELVGELSNYQALVGNNKEKAVLRAYLNAANFELEDWLPKNQAKGNKSKESDDIYLNLIDLKLKANIAQFKFENFTASKLSSNIYFRENQFRFDSLAFSCMDGKANANGAIELKEHGGFDLICDAKLSKISIDKLFEQLNNFGQKTLTDKHIAGKLSAEIKYKSSWSNLNSIIPESILADATVNITNGELNNFTPMNKLSKFVSVSELSHIKFNELANTISISNKKIYIPQFQIKSSAMNLYCSGTHDFENNIDYHFKVTLSELLSKKRKRDVPKNNEFDEIEENSEGKTTLFISMTGNIDNPKIKFDKKELKQYVKDEIKNEKNTVKQLLKDEFGLFKKDKSLKEKSDKKIVNAKEFEVEWEENDKKETEVKQPEVKNKNGSQKKSIPEKAPRKSKQKEEENSDDYL